MLGKTGREIDPTIASSREILSAESLSNAQYDPFIHLANDELAAAGRILLLDMTDCFDNLVHCSLLAIH